MVMKASIEDDDSGWELNIPEKIEKNYTSWIDITQDFEDCCRGKSHTQVLDNVRNETFIACSIQVSDNTKCWLGPCAAYFSTKSSLKLSFQISCQLLELKKIT